MQGSKWLLHLLLIYVTMLLNLSLITKYTSKRRTVVLSVRGAGSSNSDLYCKSVVICGPSGVGKGSVIDNLIATYPHKFALSVSHTSRSPRPGEVDGRHYHFVDRQQLQQDIVNGKYKYLEHAQVHSNLYGTREDSVSKVHDSGRVCILDIDSVGVKQIKANGFPAKLIFIAPPSLEVLENRLRLRGTESEENIQLRTKNAVAEVQYGTLPGNFDIVLYNDNLKETTAVVLKQLKEWFPILLQNI